MYLEQFILERNIKEETAKRYKITVKKYEAYHGETFDELLQEAMDEEDDKIPKRKRNIRARLLDFRTYLVTQTDLKIKTVKGHIRQLCTIYKQFSVEVPELPALKDTDVIETTYFDLPSKKDVGKVIKSTGIRFKALVLFMVSSGTDRDTCSKITLDNFFKACEGYYTKEDIPGIIEELATSLEPIVPTFKLFREKTQKKYYTFCTPQATEAILEWLQLRLIMCEEKGEELTLDDTLWGWSPRQITYHFTRINDELEFGYNKDGYRYFRPHALRKFNGSNIGLSDEIVDRIHGRSKDALHATYIKTNPEELKQIYMTAMDNVVIDDVTKKEIHHEEFHININVVVNSENTITI